MVMQSPGFTIRFSRTGSNAISNGIVGRLISSIFGVAPVHNTIRRLYISPWSAEYNINSLSLCSIFTILSIIHSAASSSGAANLSTSDANTCNGTCSASLYASNSSDASDANRGTDLSASRTCFTVVLDLMGPHFTPRSPPENVGSTTAIFYVISAGMHPKTNMPETPAPTIIKS